MKKLFAILMSIMMIACFMPSMAFADGEQTRTLSFAQGDTAVQDTLTATYGGTITSITVKSDDNAITSGNEATYGTLSAAVSEGDAVTAKIDDQKQLALTVVKAGTATVTVTAAAVEGSYAEGTATLNVTVAPKTLTDIDVSKVTVTKTYNGEKTAGEVSGDIEFKGKVGDDNVSITAKAGEYADQYAGNGKTVTLTLTLDGTAKDNYTLGQDGGTKTINTASITAATQTIKPETAELKKGNTLDLSKKFTSDAGAKLTFTVDEASKQYVELQSDGKTLKGLKAGDATIKVTAAEVDKDEDGTAEYAKLADGTVTVNVSEKTSISDKITFDNQNVTYGETYTPNKATLETGAGEDSGKWTYSYAGTGETTYEANENPPTNAGTYTVTAKYESENKVGTKEATLTIDKKALTIQGVKVANKVYDGTNTATIEGTPILNPEDIVAGDADKLELVTTDATATFAGKDAAENQAVTFTGYTLTGDKAANYELQQPTGVKASINKAPLSIKTVTITDKTYDETKTATVSKVEFDGLKNGETLTTGESGDYTVAGEFNDANVDKANSVKVTVTLLESSETAKNYTIEPFNVEATIAKAEPVANAPQAASVKFNGGYQDLITAGTTNDGTLLYKVGEKGSYDAAIPTAMEVGTYQVYYKVAGDANHTDKEFETPVPVTISKADARDGLTKNVVVNTADKKAQTVSLAGLMPQNAGELTYQIGEKTDDDNIIAEGHAVDENGVVTFTLAGDALTADKTAALKVTVKSTNYADSTVTINVKLTAKKVPTFEAPKAKAGLVYNGTDLALLDKGSVTGGTMLYKLVTEEKGQNDPSAENDGFSTEIPKARNAGPYVVQYKINGAEGFESIEANAVQVEITRKEAVISPENCEITEGTSIPKIKLVCAAVVKGDDLENSIATAKPEFEYYNKEGERVENPTAVGVYTIKWKDASWNAFKPNDANYDVSRGEGTLTIKEKSSTSSGGSYYPYTPSTPSTPSAPGLDKTKTDSTTALNAAATVNKYDAAEQAEVKKILDKANADIKNAKTEAEVKAIEEAAQAEIDKILTTEEKAIVAVLDNVEKRDFGTKSKVITRKGGKKVIRLTWTAPDGVDVDGYEIFRSTKKNSGFGTKPYFETTNTSYTNTKNLKPGKIYYYKVRAFVVINGERVYTDYSLQAFRTIK